MNLREFFGLVCDRFWEGWDRETRGRLFIGADMLIAMAVQMAIAAAVYGIQMLLAPKPPTMYGPRKDDLGGAQTQPGGPIPFAVGRNLARGQIIWTSGLKETKHTEKVKGGKGGGSSQKIVTYTYSTSVAIAFNDGVVNCIRRLIANGSKLLYSERFATTYTQAEIDAQVDAAYDAEYNKQLNFWLNLNYDPTNAAQRAIAPALAISRALRSELENWNAGNNKRFADIEVFYGTEDQLPSSIIESYVGVGNVSAFRGTAYIVIKDLELADFGNTTPVFDVDYAADVAVTVSAQPGSTSFNFTTPPTLVDTVETLGGAGTPVDEYSPNTPLPAGSNSFSPWLNLMDFNRRKLFTPGHGSFLDSDDRYVHELDLDVMSYTQSHDFNGKVGNNEFCMYGLDHYTGYLVGTNTFNGNGIVYDPATQTVIADTVLGSNYPSQTWGTQYAVIWDHTYGNAAILTTRWQDNSANSTHIYSMLTGGFGSPFAFQGHTPVPPTGLYFLSGYATRNDLPAGNPLASTAWGVWHGTSDIKIYKHIADFAGGWGVPVSTDTFSFNYTDLDFATTYPSGSFHRIGGAISYTIVLDDGDLLIPLFMKSNAALGSNDWFGYARVTPGSPCVIKWEYFFEDSYPAGYRVDGQQRVPSTGGSVMWHWGVNGVDYRILDTDTGLPLTGYSQLYDLGPTYGVGRYWEAWEILNKIDFGTWWWDGEEGRFYWGENNGPVLMSYAQFTAIPGQTGLLCDDPVPVSDVVANYLTRAGYTSAEWDIDAALDDITLYGMSDNGGRTVREVLEDLGRIRPVNAYESEGKIKFTMMDGDPVATIAIEDLRAYESNSEPVGYLVEVMSLEDKTLPRSLQITYRNHERLLNRTGVMFKREATQSNKFDSYEVDAVDTSAEMRVAVVNAFAQLMTGRQVFNFTLPQKYAGLEPGDRVTIPITETTNTDIRITQVVRGVNGVVEITGVLYIETSSTSLEALYGAAITQIEDFTELPTDTAQGITDARLYIIDTPYLTDLREEDDAGNEDEGFYFAVGHDGDAGAAAVYADLQKLTLTEVLPGVFEQGAGAASWELIGDFATIVDDGIYVGGLDPNATAEVTDTESVLVVTFYNPNASFATLTDEEFNSSQDNVFLIGNELLQAKTCTLAGTSDTGIKTYEFTNLWRGIRGTEWAIGQTLTVNDTNIVHINTAGIQRYDTGNLNLVGYNLDFRVAVTGQDVTGQPTITHNFQLRSRQPYAPQIWNAARDGSGNLTFQLFDRPRYGDPGGSPETITDPYDFEVDIYDTASPPTVVRTITSSGTAQPTISYTAAQQVTDFGSAQSSITVRAYQLNAQGRRGFTNEETI